MRRPPGPPLHEIFRNGLQARRDILGFGRELLEKYGDLVALRVGPLNVIVANHPDHYKHVLRDRWEIYPKSARYQLFAPMIGNGLLISEGDVWRKKRRLVQPAFARPVLEGFAPLMTESVRGMMNCWGEGPLDVYGHMCQVTLRMASRAFFGVDMGAEGTKISLALDLFMKEAEARTLSAVPRLREIIPSAGKRDFDRSVALMDEAIYGIIRQRRGQPAGAHNDLLDKFMHNADPETGHMYTDKELRDEVATMLIGGHETSANTMAWMFHLLSLNPEWQERLGEEARKLGPRDPSPADVLHLPVARAVIEETMRLLPAVWISTRQASEDDEMCGYHVPRGTIVALPSYFLHRRKAYWGPNADEFDPGRFLGGSSTHTANFAFLPFGAGSRSCIGAGFAMLEMTLLTAMVMREWRFAPLEGFPVVQDASITLRPKHGLRLRARRV